MILFHQLHWRISMLHGCSAKAVSSFPETKTHGSISPGSLLSMGVGELAVEKKSQWISEQIGRKWTGMHPKFQGTFLGLW